LGLALQIHLGDLTSLLAVGFVWQIYCARGARSLPSTFSPVIIFTLIQALGNNIVCLADHVSTLAISLRFSQLFEVSILSPFFPLP
jgi:hypothetical protein